MDAPSRIGRFVVLRELGAGAMGVVYAAYDAQLDRQIAIKVLSHGYVGAVQHGISRLEREAQALARLSHPNVVQVYEAGRVEGGIYIAMELVSGRTLRDWLGERPRDLREIVDVFLQIGAGLEAAHAKGLVHRDIKPDNILVGDDGRARLLDFSLAAPLDGDAELGAAGDLRVSSILLTQDGGFVGTPAYMAPEQFLNHPPDARSDQFSFCATLWEALHGERPFPGATIEQVRASFLRGGPAPPPHDRVPLSLRRALSRGLSIDPDARYPDIAALLVVLARDPYRLHRLLALIFVVLVLAGAAVALLPNAAIDCHNAAAGLADVYNPTRRADLKARFDRSPIPYARATGAALIPELDAYAVAWARTAEQACVATHIRHEASTDLLDRRGVCLRDRLRDLDALLSVLTHPDAAERALLAVRELARPERCMQQRAVDTSIDERVAGPLRARLAEVKAQLAAGDDARALALAHAILSEGPAPSNPALHDEALYWRGRAALAAIHPDRAADDLHPAYHGAARRGDDELAFRAAIALADVATQRAQFAIAEEWLDHAEDALARGQLDETLKAQLELRRGEALGDAGRPADALVALDRALALLGPDRPDAHELARVHLLRGIALRDLGRIDEALTAFARDEEILRAAFGPEHPSLVVPLNNHAATLLDQGRAEEALALFERGLSIRLRAYGRDHLRTAFSLSQQGEALTDLRRLAEAERAFTEALAIRTRLLGPDHPDVAETLTGLGNLYLILDRHDEALRRFTEALQIRQAIYGEDHEIAASAHRNLADAARAADDLDLAETHLQRAESIWRGRLPPGHRKLETLARDRGRLAEARGDLDGAAAHYAHALELAEARVGPHDPELGQILRLIGHLERLRGARERALHAFERAAALPPGGRPVRPDELAPARFDMAVLLWPEDQRRARAEAGAAAAALQAAGTERALLREIEAWLRTR